MSNNDSTQHKTRMGRKQGDPCLVGFLHHLCYPKNGCWWDWAEWLTLYDLSSNENTADGEGNANQANKQSEQKKNKKGSLPGQPPAQSNHDGTASKPKGP